MASQTKSQSSVSFGLALVLMLVAGAVGCDEAVKTLADSETIRAAKESDAGRTVRECKIGNKKVGEACMRDNECTSGECKKLSCIDRDTSKRPFLDDGASCKFDGDCCSGDCKRFKCQAR